MINCGNHFPATGIKARQKLLPEMKQPAFAGCFISSCRAGNQAGPNAYRRALTAESTAA